MPDAYELLGLKPGVSEPEIKRAFKRLAMKWHPDRNPDPIAAEHFRALRRAHDHLLSAFDTPAGEGDHRADDAAPPRGKTHRERSTSPERGKDRRQDLVLEFEDVFLGGEKSVCITDDVECADCQGSGAQSLSFGRLCQPCRGSGRIRTDAGLGRCAACDGRGYRYTQDCAGCGGSGHQLGERWLQVKIPVGLIDGDELRLAGEGEPGVSAGAMPGDLRLRVQLAPHPIFHRDGRNLHLQRPVSAMRMLIGGPLRIPHPAGQRSVFLEPGVAHSRTIRVEGGGFPPRRGLAAGDLIVELVPVLPQVPDARLRALIDQLDAELTRSADKHLPEVARWEHSWLD